VNPINNEMENQIVEDTRRWMERAVIGLNLCPFAKAVYVKGQIHYAVCLAFEPADVLDELVEELKTLIGWDAQVRDTTLVILPNALGEFLDFNDFLIRANALLRKLRLDSIVQIAPFHPRFQFADVAHDDIANCTNRSPYPMLHLLREASVNRAVAVFPEAEAIFEQNIQTLTALGAQGWAALDVGAHATVDKIANEGAA
jgi:uncharacterized protein